MTELRREVLDDGAFWRVVLDGPPGNVLDTRAMADLSALAEAAGMAEALRGILFVGAGKHFSFGASVEDHLPGKVGDFLPAFGAAFRALAECGVPLVAAVRGQCLGGGFELAAFCHFLFCDDTARFAQPEIKLGVFPPLAALILPERVGQGRADDWILTGRTIRPDEARTAGLLTGRAAEDAEVESVALGWMRERLGPSSAFALRQATRASRVRLQRILDDHLTALEVRYLEELMGGEDPLEGLSAFLEKRPPAWRHR